MASILIKVSNLRSVLFRNVSYHSAISLSKLYPNSSLRITTPTLLSSDKNITSKFSGVIPIDKLDITYSRSSGPGGQNVNTVSTKVDLRFHVETAEWLDSSVRKQILENHKSKITKDGYLVIKSELTRSQQLNLADALEKLRTLIRASLQPVKQEMSAESVHLLQKRIAKSNKERLLVKRQRSQIKSDRQAPNVSDF